MSALAHLQAERSRMSATDRKIADFILDNAPLLRDYSSQQLADVVKVSQSSVVKFAQRLGFDGYPDLKLSVNEAVTRAAAESEASAGGGHAPAADAEATGAEVLWSAKAAAELSTRQRNDADMLDTIAAWLFVTQTLILLIPTIIVWNNPTPEQWGLFAVIGFMSVILQRTYNRGVQAADMSIAMPFNFTRLIWAAILGWLVFAELPDIWTWIGGTIIFAASVWLTQLGRSGR